MLIVIDVSGVYVGEMVWVGSGGGQSVVEMELMYQLNFWILLDSFGLCGLFDVVYDVDLVFGFVVYDLYGYVGQGGWFVVGGMSVGVL